MSGARSDRPELKKALATLSDGDVLVVTQLDRLARSTRDLLDIVHMIETQGAKLKALADSWADTTTSTGRLILTVLGGLAEFGRSLIVERTAEGRGSHGRSGCRALRYRGCELPPLHAVPLRDRSTLTFIDSDVYTGL